MNIIFYVENVKKQYTKIGRKYYIVHVNPGVTWFFLKYIDQMSPPTPLLTLVFIATSINHENKSHFLVYQHTEDFHT